jgi:hypothetical protein
MNDDSAYPLAIDGLSRVCISQLLAYDQCASHKASGASSFHFLVQC